jgi:hypothetical protein
MAFLRGFGLQRITTFLSGFTRNLLSSRRAPGIYQDFVISLADLL